MMASFCLAGFDAASGHIERPTWQGAEPSADLSLWGVEGGLVDKRASDLLLCFPYY